MSNISFELQDQLLPVLRAGDIVQCEQTVAARLASLPRSPFHSILDLAIDNSPSDVASYFDEFFRAQPRDKVEAAYTEMNGFGINPNLWFCSPFAYQQYGGHDDYDWLSNWQSDDYDHLPITGLEALQAVYASNAFRDKRVTDARDITSLLVVIKFQDLIRRAVSRMEELRFPLLVTAHDYDFIYEARPAA
jgi:hypothetical protein